MILTILLAVIFLIPLPALAQSPDTLYDTVQVPRQAPTPIRIEINDLIRQADRHIDLARGGPPEVAQAERLMQDDQYDEAVKLLQPLFESDPSNNAVASSLKRAYTA